MIKAGYYAEILVYLYQTTKL